MAGLEKRCGSEGGICIIGPGKGSGMLTLREKEDWKMLCPGILRRESDLPGSIYF